MNLNKSTGDMYPQIDATITYTAGKCPNDCSYCFVKDPPFCWIEKYHGPFRPHGKEFTHDLSKAEVCRSYNIPGVPKDLPLVFVGSCTDLFHPRVPNGHIKRVLRHVGEYDVAILLQSKGPWRMRQFEELFPENTVLATTAETNFFINYPKISNAPLPGTRLSTMKLHEGGPVLISIEPVLPFNLEKFLDALDFPIAMVSIGGSTSTRADLPQVDPVKLSKFIRRLKKKPNIKSVLLKKNLKDTLGRVGVLKVDWNPRGALVKEHPQAVMPT